MKMRVATDVGGTFTDIVCLEIDEAGKQIINIAKTDTTPSQFEQGVLKGMQEANIPFAQISDLAHGTTIIINALTERTGVKTGLITTQGFSDILEIARGNRPDFFNLDYQKPRPFIPRYLRKAVPGRISPKGEEIESLDLSSLPDILTHFKREGVQSIAVCFINSYVNDNHEKIVVEAIHDIWPEVFVTRSSQITREWREYERTNTAVLSAYVQPIAYHYLNKLSQQLHHQSFEGNLYIMQSNCGVDTVQRMKETPIMMVESGPASGVWGARALGQIINENNIIALDIGGTTAKCSLINEGNIRINTNYLIECNKTSAGYPIMAPVVDLVEIGNGGGSIAWVDAFQKLHVGPQSAGAYPGPVAYNLGGDQPTTADANLALARINPHYFCGGKIVANMPAVEKSLCSLGTSLEMDADTMARNIIRIANNNMVNAIKLVSVNRGYDPRDFTMVAFGGGGGLHASFLARELGIKKVIIPKQSEVFSAWGMLMCDIRRDFFQTKIIELEKPKISEMIDNTLSLLEENAMRTLTRENIQVKDVAIERYGCFRYRNQAHMVEVAIPEGVLTAEMMTTVTQNFHEAYKREYTYQLLDSPVDLVGFHLVTMVEVEKAQPMKLLQTSHEGIVKGERKVDFAEEGIHQTVIYNGDLLPSQMSFKGPAIIETVGSSVVVCPQMPVTVDDYGNIHILTNYASEILYHNPSDFITQDIIQNSLQAISDEMFAAMRRTAMSSIIYEVLDMGTAITNKHGELASSGAGIPAFSNTLDRAVQQVAAQYADSLHEGDLFIINDPYQGGITHLNDVILMLPVFYDKELIAWTVNIAHWSDIGGKIPGSMAPDATELFQEGVILPAVKLFDKGQFNRSLLTILKANTRMPDFLEGDLWAGIAALRIGEKRIIELVNKYSKETFLTAVENYLNYGEQVTRHGLKRLPPLDINFTEKQENGTQWTVKINTAQDFVVDLRDNPDQMKLPYNTSLDTVIIAAQLVLKSITSPETLCNSGTFRPLKVLTRQGSIFNPVKPAPMGFYYETFIRVYDLIWQALAQSLPELLPAGHFASICGTIIGGTHPDTGQSYTIIEPELGGWGASSVKDGNAAIFSGLHGETYNCPVEITEARNGIYVDQLSLHNDDGGEGQYRGGQGICLTYRMRTDDAFLVASYTRSKIPPWGLAGGRSGSTNYIEVLRTDGSVEKYSEASGIGLKTNDRIRIKTAHGAGWGDPKKRDEKKIIEDLKNGYITTEQAKKYYGFECPETTFFKSAQKIMAEKEKLTNTPEFKMTI